ncbi:MAG: hypothetical protein FWD25_02595 [Clostridia bacterium]|nr:hypothetical protein [Clostridia bacterium]
MKPINTKMLSTLPVIGFVLIVLSFAIKFLGVPESACCFIAGLGCAWVGLGAVGAIVQRLNPQYAKKLEIQQKDERNMVIREKAGYIAFLVTLFALAMLAFVFLLLGSDLACALALVAMAVHVGSFFVAMLVYDKQL